MGWSRGKAYSQDLRERVFALADDGYGVCEVAEQLLVSVSYVSKVLSRRRLTGEVSARPQCCHVPPKLIDLQAAIAAQVAASIKWTGGDPNTMGEQQRDAGPEAKALCTP